MYIYLLDMVKHKTAQSCSKNILLLTGINVMKVYYTKRIYVDYLCQEIMSSNCGRCRNSL